MVERRCQCCGQVITDESNKALIDHFKSIVDRYQVAFRKKFGPTIIVELSRTYQSEYNFPSLNILHIPDDKIDEFVEFELNGLSQWMEENNLPSALIFEYSESESETYFGGTHE